MNTPRFSTAAAGVVAAAIAFTLAGCGAPPAKRFSEAEPLRTADIVYAPAYDAGPTTGPPAPAPSAAPAAPVAPAAPDVTAMPVATAAPVAMVTPDAAATPVASAGPPAPAREPPSPASAPRGESGAAPAARLAAAAAATAPAPAPKPAAERPPSAPPAASTPLAPGRWAVQVGVFAVPANAERDRARVAERLASTDVAAAQRIVRVERIGNRSHVLVGDLPDRDAALALAAQLRRALNHDVVVLRR